MTYRVATQARTTSLDLDPTVWVLHGPGGRAEVWPALGFNCYRWQVVRQGSAFELLYAAPNLFEEHAPTRSGFPILFPFPNRIRDGRFTWDGKKYELPRNDPSGKNAIHGFACRRPWRVVDHGADGDSAWVTGEFHALQDSPDSLALWPSDHRIRVTYRLSGNGLRIESIVDNPDRVPLPFGLGYHPYFRIPFREGADSNAYRVSVPASGYWNLEECLPHGPVRVVDQRRDLRTPVPFPRLQVDDVLTNLTPLGQECGRIEEPLLGMRLLCSPDFREMVVFTPGHRQAVCLEPYTCVTDAINLQARGIDTGWRVLQPGERWQGFVQCIL